MENYMDEEVEVILWEYMEINVILWEDMDVGR